MSSADFRTVVVSGGSRGIGRAVCLALSGPESRVYFNYRSDAAAAEETRDLIRRNGGQAECLCADVASESDVGRFFQKVLDDTGRVDVLVNNAGITRDGLLVRMKPADWEAVISVNLGGVFNFTKAAVKPMMRQHAGRIISITSVVGVTGNPGQANYAASKAGIIGFTKSLAKELASRNITVNAIAPGYVETDMTADLSQKARDAMLELIPLRRPGTGEEVAAAVKFLASEEAAYITGPVLHVSGGLYI
jgi:3-oxoacyl-[acyl-carrier protein] reductase